MKNNVLYFVKEGGENILVMEIEGDTMPFILRKANVFITENPQYEGKLYVLYQGREFRIFTAVATETEEEKFYRDVLEKIANFANGKKLVNGSDFYKMRMRRKYPRARQYKELLQAMEEKGLIILHKQKTKTYEIEISKTGYELKEKEVDQSGEKNRNRNPQQRSANPK